jgi:hypothetical protein
MTRNLICITMVLLFAGPAAAYSTLSGVTVTRSFSPTTAQPGQKVTVTLSVKTGSLSSSLRGFYLSEAVPDALSPASLSATLGGSAATVKTETTASGTVYSGAKTVRWVLEQPPSWTENTPFPASTELKVTYSVTVPSSATSGFSFPGAMWVGMIPSLGDSGDHFGYEDKASTLPVTPATPALALNPTSLSFSVQEGDAAPTAQQVTASNTGGGTLATVSPDIKWGASGSGWLTVTQSGSGDSQSLENKVDPSGLAPNTYSATVEVSATGATNSPQSYTVSFTVKAKPSTTDPTIALDPTTVSFSAVEGGGAPASQSVAVTNVGAGTMASVTPTVSYINGSDWLTVTASGSDDSQSLENTVDPTGLSPDTYTATVSVDAPGASNTPQNYTVSLTVAPSGSTIPGSDGGVGYGDGGIVIGEGGPLLRSVGTLEGGCAVGRGHGAVLVPLLLLVLGLALLGRTRRS